MAPARRDEGLSRERVVDAAIALLDQQGEGGLTFRALATRLGTGAGAIYWHVSDKQDLLVAACDAVVARVMDGVRPGTRPREAIRRLAVGVFDAVDAHPWAGAQLFHAPWPAATLQIFERIGRQLQALGVPAGGQFSAASALVSYILGVSVQNAAQSRALDSPVSRAAYLATEAARWKQLDAEAYPFIRSVAAQLRRHDDRAEFLAGIDLVLAGILRDA
jgi:AcrR family transcriptional regulator